MSFEQEISRLQDLMPASGRMFCRIISKPQQSRAILAPFTPPWKRGSRPIYINFDLWRGLSRPQRDLMFLRTVSSVLGVKWFTIQPLQGLALAGVVGLAVEVAQTDVVGILVAGSLTAVALRQIWQKNRHLSKEIEADEAGIKVAIRRGYTETESARHLLEALEALPNLERRRALDFGEIVRCQNLRSIARLSPVTVPKEMEIK
ncbi:MAG: DUF3318 domain-containing protein [Cyanobacterium sp. T60_A2020_053]|nr:DUF3318 domain-containing protein [Cyanobacterium sp. T60_A2020_053]